MASELKDQFFQAIERGDTSHVRKLLKFFPSLRDEDLFTLTPLNYSVRLGHTDIALALGLPLQEAELYKLVMVVAPLGHKEMLALLVYYFAKWHPQMANSLSAPQYAAILRLDVPQSCRYAVYFPYIWARICPLLYILSKRKLKDLPVKSIAKYLY